jgi:hypothetical protein
LADRLVHGRKIVRESGAYCACDRDRGVRDDVLHPASLLLASRLTELSGVLAVRDVFSVRSEVIDGIIVVP